MRLAYQRCLSRNMPAIVDHPSRAERRRAGDRGRSKYAIMVHGVDVEATRAAASTRIHEESILTRERCTRSCKAHPGGERMIHASASGTGGLGR
jgi:hypothetical protein